MQGTRSNLEHVCVVLKFRAVRSEGSSVSRSRVRRGRCREWHFRLKYQYA